MMLETEDRMERKAPGFWGLQSSWRQQPGEEACVGALIEMHQVCGRCIKKGTVLCHMKSTVQYKSNVSHICDLKCPGSHVKKSKEKQLTLF